MFADSFGDRPPVVRPYARNRGDELAAWQRVGAAFLSIAPIM